MMDDLQARSRYIKCAKDFEKVILPKFGIQTTEKTKKEIATLFSCIDYVDQIKDDKILPNNTIDKELLLCLRNLDIQFPENFPNNSKTQLEELRSMLHRKNLQEQFAKILEDITVQEQKLSETIDNQEYIIISKKLGELYAALFNISFDDVFNKELQKFLTSAMIRANLRDNYEDLAEDRESGRSKITITQALKLRFFKETFVGMIKIYRTYPDKWDARKRLFMYTGKMIQQL